MKIGCAAFVGAFTIAVFAASPGAAQTIGGAVAVQREVSGQLSGSPRAIATGDDVHQNETIRTGAASSAELGFVDLRGGEARPLRLRSRPGSAVGRAHGDEGR